MSASPGMKLLMSVIVRDECVTRNETLERNGCKGHEEWVTVSLNNNNS